jgi:hypothetical protein
VRKLITPSCEDTCRCEEVVLLFGCVIFMMSDSESTENSTTPALPFTAARGTWSGKRQKSEQAAKARSMKSVRASTTGESGPSSSLSVPRMTSENEIETPTPMTGDRMTASHDRQGREGGTCTGRETIGGGDPSTETAPTTQPQTGDEQANIQPAEDDATPSVSGSSPLSPRSLAWSRKRSQKERAARMRRGSGGDVQESEGNTPARDPDFAYRSEEEPEHDGDEEFAPQELFDDWMLSLRLDQRMMLSVILMETFNEPNKNERQRCCYGSWIGGWVQREDSAKIQE